MVLEVFAVEKELSVVFEEIDVILLAAYGLLLLRERLVFYVHSA